MATYEQPLGAAFKPTDSRDQHRQNKEPTQALRVALTSGPEEVNQWTIIWYRRPQLARAKGSAHRQYGGRHWFYNQTEAIERARQFIKTRPALIGDTVLEVEDEGFYDENETWVTEVRKI